MATDAWQFYYECMNCQAVLRPLDGDCCVFCSYADTLCPLPIHSARPSKWRRCPVQKFLRIETPFVAMLSGLLPLPW